MEDNILYVGIMGYSSQKFDPAKALGFLNEAFDHIQAESDDREIRIVSGYTNLGIPALAYTEAVRRGWKTIGIACAKAKDFEVFPCDEVKIVGENWGDESPVFLTTCDVFVRIGGGKQSLREIAQAKQEGRTVYEYELEALPT